MIFEVEDGLQKLLALPLISCVALGKLFVLVILLIPHPPSSLRLNFADCTT